MHEEASLLNPELFWINASELQLQETPYGGQEMFSPEKGAETLLSFDQQRAGKKNRCTVSTLTGKLVYQEFRMANWCTVNSSDPIGWTFASGVDKQDRDQS